MALDLGDLAALDTPTPGSGAPLLLPVADIDEDPEQPRLEFGDESLQALADTIRQRGVRQPISVRAHRQHAGRWMVNFGARRLRAARLAGQQQVPAFVDETADSYDQVLENEQREALTPLELALFIQKRLKVGEHQAEIARRLGKSRQWVQAATVLIDPPDWLMTVYRSGRCRGLNELQDLRRLHEAHGPEVEQWLSEQPVATRDRIADLKAKLATASECKSVVSGRLMHIEPTTKTVLRAKTPGASKSAPASPQSTGQPPRVRVELDGAICELLVHTVPEQAGCMYVRTQLGAVEAAPVDRLKLLGF